MERRNIDMSFLSDIITHPAYLQIIDQLSDFYEPEDARMWVFSRQKLLGGATPAELIQKGNTGSVIAVINQLRDGVFV